MSYDIYEFKNILKYHFPQCKFIIGVTFDEDEIEGFTGERCTGWTCVKYKDEILGWIKNNEWVWPYANETPTMIIKGEHEKQSIIEWIQKHTGEKRDWD